MRDQTRQSLRFTSLHLEQWRNFSAVTVDLQRRVFLVGPNASGKSNFLDVFRFLRDIVALGGGFQEAVRKRNGVSSIRCLAARRYPDIRVDVQIGTADDEGVWRYVLTFYQDKSQRPLIRSEQIFKQGQEVLRRPRPEDEKDPARLTQTYLEQVSVNKDFREMVDFLSSVRYLHIVPQLVREPDRSVGRKNDPYGGDFLEQVAAKPKRTQEAWLKRICQALSVAAPQLKELELFRDARGTPHLRGRHEHWRPQGAWQYEDSFSDGTLRLMGLLWAVLDGGGPLLLEEPELSLHPDVVRFIPQTLARVQRHSGRQVILSSHSSDLLRDEGIGTDEVLLITPHSEGSAIRVASKFREVKELLEGGSTLADVVIPLTKPQRADQLPLALFAGPSSTRTRKAASRRPRNPSLPGVNIWS
jgi:predicted ATPase